MKYVVSAPWVRFSGVRPFFSTMREFLLGVLGSGLTYAVLWYQMTPAADVVRAPPASPRPVASATGRDARPSTATAREPRPARHVPSEAGSNEGALWDAKRQPGELEPRPTEAFHEPLPKALRTSFERMAELNRVSADPDELANRLQAMETSEAELAELKAFAERFVELPPDRVERHIPGTSRTSVSSNGRPRQR